VRHARASWSPGGFTKNTDDMPVYLPNERGEVLNNDFFGGNLRGILEKLPYLQELGAEILYLNPIFFAFSTPTGTTPATTARRSAAPARRRTLRLSARKPTRAA
jgi:hypothetical protein